MALGIWNSFPGGWGPFHDFIYLVNSSKTALFYSSPILTKWVDYDGIGRNGRNGLSFTEHGFGIRRSVGCSDRGNTSVSQLKPGDIDWDHLFGEMGVRWFHTAGIFAAWPESTGPVVIAAAKAAEKHCTIVSYDLNYRPSLQEGLGGLDRCHSNSIGDQIPFPIYLHFVNYKMLPFNVKSSTQLA